MKKFLLVPFLLMASLVFGQASYSWTTVSLLSGLPRNAVIGGQEAGQSLYICRANYDDGVFPGKVVGPSCKIGYAGGEISVVGYQVLVGEGGTWAKPEITLEGALVVGQDKRGNQQILCRANFRGIHPGRVVENRCNIAYGGRELVVEDFEVLYSIVPTAPEPAPIATEPIEPLVPEPAPTIPTDTPSSPSMRIEPISTTLTCEQSTVLRAMTYAQLQGDSSPSGLSQALWQWSDCMNALHNTAINELGDKGAQILEIRADMMQLAEARYNLSQLRWGVSDDYALARAKAQSEIENFIAHLIEFSQLDTSPYLPSTLDAVKQALYGELAGQKGFLNQLDPNILANDLNLSPSRFAPAWRNAVASYNTAHDHLLSILSSQLAGSLLEHDVLQEFYDLNEDWLDGLDVALG
ncbi:MAG: DUF3421 domain-containing protein [Deinococcales bacterium]